MLTHKLLLNQKTNSSSDNINLTIILDKGFLDSNQSYITLYDEYYNPIYKSEYLIGGDNAHPIIDTYYTPCIINNLYTLKIYNEPMWAMYYTNEIQLDMGSETGISFYIKGTNPIIHIQLGDRDPER